MDDADDHDGLSLVKALARELETLTDMMIRGLQKACPWTRWPPTSPAFTPGVSWLCWRAAPRN
jgi:hypothetical protein